jgi:tetratricopeptide (TPR) repeat protein
MYKPTSSRSLLLLLAALALASPAFSQVQQMGRIFGEVRIQRGDFPPQPVLVSLQFRGSTIGSVYTDGQGRFGFYDLSANPYHVVVSDDDYDSVDDLVNLDPVTNSNVFVSIVLNPKQKAKPAATGGVGGSNPYVISAADYNKKFPKKAVKEFDKAVEADRDGDRGAAIAHYEKALAIAPDYYPACNNLGSAYVANRQFDRAETMFRKAVELNQSDPQAYFNLANVYMLTGRYNDASPLIDEGLKRRADSAFGYFLRGSLYCRTGELDQAEKNLRTALQLDPTMSQAYLQLVNLYIQQKRNADAITELQAYLHAFPDAEYSAKARDVLKRLQSDATVAQ